MSDTCAKIQMTICDYYLRCIAYDQPEVGVYVNSQFAQNPSQLDYVAAPHAPDSPQFSPSLKQPPVSAWLNKVTIDPSKRVFFGYPIFVQQTSTGPTLWPILLVPLDPQTGQADDLPLLNFGALKKLPTVADCGTTMDEALQLFDWLGLTAPPDQLPDFPAVAARLREARPDWPWKEALTLDAISVDSGLAGLAARGIYNRAALFTTDKPSFTAGLEVELKKLANVATQALAGTALGHWLGIQPPIGASPALGSDVILEPMPLNTEQRRAVSTALTQPLTVITGPPGTGKSQLVAAIVVNAAHRGETVLLASRNNKAVDVVETRVNALAARPAVLRLGGMEHLDAVTASIDQTLAAAVDPNDNRKIEEAESAHDLIKQGIADLDRDLAEILKLRNEMQGLAERCEPLRERIGETRFKRLNEAPIAEWRARIDAAEHRLAKACRVTQPTLVRLAWPILRRQRMRRAAEALAGVVEIADVLAIPVPESPLNDGNIAEHQHISAQIGAAFADIETGADYWRRMRALNQGRTPPDVARERMQAIANLAQNSRQLWELSLRTAPARLSAGERQPLANFNATLRLINSANNGGGGGNRGLWRQYYALFPQTLQTLRCWCVTNLRARGLPFEPGAFDLVVIDEASQSDIASALPLLYRAKRAVIIGDPMQLPHITAMPERQDVLLMGTHNIPPGWSYSVNSLFDRAVGLVDGPSVINLRDHFRSVDEIIRFANSEFYDGRLRIATRYESLKVRLDPPVRWINVPGRVEKTPKQGIVNHQEAVQVVGQLRQLVDTVGFNGTIGIVTPFRGQVDRINLLVEADAVLANRLRALDFLCHTAHGFQGDERDVMLFSTVIAPGIADGTKWFLSGGKSRNLFNVAITRARGGLIVVGDHNAALHSGIPHLERFVQYVDDIQSKQREASVTEAVDCGPEHPITDDPTVSDWERRLYRALYAKGLRPVPQYPMDKYRLDLALFAGDRRLDVEVDGEHYHRAWDGGLLYEDKLRNQRLIELDWDVMRFWVWQVRDDLDGVVDRVVAWAN